MRGRRGPTFAELVQLPTWSEEHPPPPVRPGGVDDDGRLVTPDGLVLEQAHADVTPGEARKLVAEGALAAWEGCGCGGWAGCAPLWADDDARGSLARLTPHLRRRGGTPTWIDVWAADGTTAVFLHGDADWGALTAGS